MYLYFKLLIQTTYYILSFKDHIKEGERREIEREKVRERERGKRKERMNEQNTNKEIKNNKK